MTDPQNEVIAGLISRLYYTQAGIGPSVQTQIEVPRALLAIADQSAEARDKIIQALIELIEDTADGGEDTAFSIASDLLGKLKATEAIDTLVKYLDYQPGKIGSSLNYRPAVKGLIQIGEAIIPKVKEALISGKSVLAESNQRLRNNAVTALLHIGGAQARGVLERAYSMHQDENLRDWIRFAIGKIDRAEAEKGSYVTRPRPGNLI